MESGMEVQSCTPFDSHRVLYGTRDRTPYFANIMAFDGQNHVEYQRPTEVAVSYNGVEGRRISLKVSVERDNFADQTETRYDSDDSYSHPSSRRFAGVVSHSPKSNHSSPLLASEQHEHAKMSVRRARSGPTTLKERLDDDSIHLREMQHDSRWGHGREYEDYPVHVKEESSRHPPGIGYVDYYERDGDLSDINGNGHGREKESQIRLGVDHQGGDMMPRHGEAQWQREGYSNRDRHVQYADDEWEKDLEGYGRYEGHQDVVMPAGPGEHNVAYGYDENAASIRREVEHDYGYANCHGRDEYKYQDERQLQSHTDRLLLPTSRDAGRFPTGQAPRHLNPELTATQREHKALRRTPSTHHPFYNSAQLHYSPDHRGGGSPFVARGRLSSPHTVDGRYMRVATHSAPYIHAERPFRSQPSYDEHWAAPPYRKPNAQSPEAAAGWGRLRDELPTKRPSFPVSSASAPLPTQWEAGGKRNHRFSEHGYGGGTYETGSQVLSGPHSVRPGPARPAVDPEASTDLTSAASGTKSSGSNGAATNSGNDDEKTRESRRHKGNRPLRRCLWDGPEGCNITEATHRTQWRKGPEGPGTLCNKHGLQYKYPSDKARRNETRRKTYAERKRHDDHVAVGGGMYVGHNMVSMHRDYHPESGSDSGPLYYS